MPRCRTCDQEHRFIAERAISKSCGLRVTLTVADTYGRPPHHPLHNHKPGQILDQRFRTVRLVGAFPYRKCFACAGCGSDDVDWHNPVICCQLSGKTLYQHPDLSDSPQWFISQVAVRQPVRFDFPPLAWSLRTAPFRSWKGIYIEPEAVSFVIKSRRPVWQQVWYLHMNGFSWSEIETLLDLPRDRFWDYLAVGYVICLLVVCQFAVRKYKLKQRKKRQRCA